MTRDTLMELGADLHHEVSRFLFAEARLLDAHDFEGWLALVTEDVRYCIPTRTTREKRDGPGVNAHSFYIEENAQTLATRIARLGTRSAWSDDPPSRTRHFITNVMLVPAERPDELVVHSYLLFSRNRGDRAASDQLTGERTDLLRRVDNAWKLASREVVFDQVVLGTLNLNTIY